MALLIATLLVESSGMYCGNDACLLPFLFTIALELYSYCTACAGWNFSLGVMWRFFGQVLWSASFSWAKVVLLSLLSILKH